MYRRDTGAVIVRDEDEQIEGCFNFIGEATESEVEDELAQRAVGEESRCNQVQRNYGNWNFLGIAMPEVTVNKHRDLLPDEYEIRPVPAA